MEEWNLLEYAGHTYYEDIEIEIKNKVDFNPGADKLAVRKLWRDVCRYTGQAENAFPPIETVIRDKELGVALIDLPAE